MGESQNSVLATCADILSIVFFFCYATLLRKSSLLQWTTDEDLTEAIRTIGISDVIEIKFYENRANGQSKG